MEDNYILTREQFVSYVTRLLKVNGLKSSQLAKRMGMQHSTLSNCLSDKMKNLPAIGTLNSLARFLEMPLSDLIEAIQTGAEPPRIDSKTIERDLLLDAIEVLSTASPEAIKEAAPSYRNIDGARDKVFGTIVKLEQYAS